MRNARRLEAPAAAFGWILGLYVLPLAHNLDHRDDHTATAQHSHPHEPHDKVPLDSDHGAGSILHFAAAALETRAVDLPRVGPLAPLPPPPSRRVAPSISAHVILVRGPPVVDFL